jgi:hypothetical protein
LPTKTLLREPNAISNAIGFAKFYSRSHNAMIRVCDEAGNVMRALRDKKTFGRTLEDRFKLIRAEIRCHE